MWCIVSFNLIFNSPLKLSRTAPIKEIVSLSHWAAYLSFRSLQTEAKNKYCCCYCLWYLIKPLILDIIQATKRDQNNANKNKQYLERRNARESTFTSLALISIIILFPFSHLSARERLLLLPESGNNTFISDFSLLLVSLSKKPSNTILRISSVKGPYFFCFWDQKAYFLRQKNAMFSNCWGHPNVFIFPQSSVWWLP